jgi:hypothetical protein
MSKRDEGRKKKKSNEVRAPGRDVGESTRRPDQPANWRDVIRADYDYPDDIDELSRRERRKAKRAWRRDDQAQRMVWLRERRQAEPTSPVAVVVAVVILAIVVLGIGGGLPRILRGEKPESRNVGLLTPSLPPGQPDTTGQPGGTTPSVLSPTSTSSIPPVLTERPSASATTAASDVTTSWARAFYTRDPTVETYDELVAKTAQFMTAEVASSFVAAGDSTYDALKADRGKSTIVSVAVAAPRPDSAPVDTPTRISRLVTVTIDVSGKQPGRITLPLVVTLTPQGSQWVISDVNGGSGP